MIKNLGGNRYRATFPLAHPVLKDLEEHTRAVLHKLRFEVGVALQVLDGADGPKDYHFIREVLSDLHLFGTMLEHDIHHALRVPPPRHQPNPSQDGGPEIDLEELGL